jgi:WhiB family redox-sensing transcriptional regulator
MSERGDAIAAARWAANRKARRELGWDYHANTPDLTEYDAGEALKAFVNTKRDLHGDASFINKAACRGADPTSSVFHPKRGEDERPAKAICGGCPVTDECLAYALLNPTLSGIWGGMSHRQRKDIKRATKAAA